MRYLVQNGEVRVLPVRPIGKLFGVLRHGGQSVTLEDMERAMAEEACGD